MRDAFFFIAGLAFLLMAKLKHALLGYSSPKPFDTSQADRCAEYDIAVVDAWLRHLGWYLGRDTDAASTHCIGDVLELGPGSDLGVGVCLLSKGARTYRACDVNSLAHAAPDALYDALFSRISVSTTPDCVEQLRRHLAESRDGTSSRLRYVVRDDFDLVSAFGVDVVDLVFSQAAFEHFDDVDAVIERLSRVCRTGAVLVAEIDLQTHSRWIRDKDPNNIYRYPRWLYRAFSFRGSPNRVRPRQYVEALERCGWSDVSVRALSHARAHDSSGLDTSFQGAASEMNLLSVVICARLAGLNSCDAGAVL